ncbi:hypothetical protein L0Y34_01855, partial [Candidatus Parcubacteria bacterium]|nr:hypothetical protein [Candidatus Parcubacteria bacterium]
MQFLSSILDIIFPPRDTERLVRTFEANALHALVSPVSVPTGKEYTSALLPYRNPLVQACVVEAKYYDNKKAQLLLGEVLADYLLEFLEDERAFGSGRFFLIPIPLSRARRHERGYNQVERVCEYACEKLYDAVMLTPHALARVRDTAPQTSLSGAKRRTNMEGAFSAHHINPHDTYIVVDDVTTTGAT